MRIIFFLISASSIFAAEFEFNHSSSLVGKTGIEESDLHKEFKFIASFRRKNVHFCTAGLISNKHVLTTAFCIKDFLIYPEIPKFNLYSIWAGKSDTAEGAIRFPIEEVQAHRLYKYYEPKVYYDVGLVTLRDNSVVESTYIGWAVWLSWTRPFPVKTYDVTLWRNTNGSRKIDEKSHLTLEKITFKVIGKDNCGFRSDSPIICAEPINENQNFFKEDIGAPLSIGYLIKGVLASVPIGPRHPAIFVDLLRFSNEISRLLNDHNDYFRISLPRKKARFDANISYGNGQRSVRHKSNEHKGSLTQYSIED